MASKKKKGVGDNRRHYPVFLILGSSVFPWRNKGTQAYMIQGEIQQAKSPDQVFNALMIPEYKGPKDKTFVFTGICNEEIKVPLEAPGYPMRTVVADTAKESDEIKAFARSMGAGCCRNLRVESQVEVPGCAPQSQVCHCPCRALPYQYCRQQDDKVKAMIAAKATLEFSTPWGRLHLFLAQAIRDMGYPAGAHYESWEPGPYHTGGNRCGAR